MCSSDLSNTTEARRSIDRRADAPGGDGRSPGGDSRRRQATCLVEAGNGHSVVTLFLAEQRQHVLLALVRLGDHRGRGRADLSEILAEHRPTGLEVLAIREDVGGAHHVLEGEAAGATVPAPCELTLLAGRPVEAEACVEATIERFGGIDVLVNGAAMRERALSLIQQLPPESVVVPAQALGELFNVLVRKAKRRRTRARAAILMWRDAYAVVETSSTVLVAALDLAANHELGIWDSVILSAAAEAECRLLLSEDLQDGFTWRGVTVTNPFTEPLHPMLAAVLVRESNSTSIDE